MHSYSTDNGGSKKVIGVIGALSFAVTLLGPAYIPGLGVLSFAFVFAILYAVFSRWVWQWGIVRSISIVQVPDFRGTWTGHIETSYDGDIPDEAISARDDPDSDYTRIDATLKIDQRWRAIDVHLETARSSSDSKAATVLVNDGVWPSLCYQHQNDPRPNTPDGMQMHHGTADLNLQSDEEQNVLEGLYYTGPGRKNHGEMRFVREDQP